MMPPVVTATGTVLGTVGYMSPEQVRAQAVDRRSDIFSFGCVLYEMVSGRRAFARGTTVETMTAILNDDPPGFETLARPGSPASPVPAALSRLVLHCLEKDPNERFQSARDLAFDLQSLAGPSSSETVAPRVEPRRSRAAAWLAVSILAAGAAAAAFLAGAWLGAGRSAANRVPVAEVRPLTFQPALELDPSLSPDGQTFVFSANYAGNDDIWSQRVGGQNPVNLTKDCDKRDYNPAFSPTGDRIAYRTECGGGGIWVMGATGESPRGRPTLASTLRGLRMVAISSWPPTAGRSCTMPPLTVRCGWSTSTLVSSGSSSRGMLLVQAGRRTGSGSRTGIRSTANATLQRWPRRPRLRLSPQLSPRLSPCPCP
jgi:hypothetical protein